MYGRKTVTSPADFLPHYESCKTHRESNEVYKSLVLENNPMTTETLQALQESLRLAHCRIVEARDAPPPSEITRTRRDNSDVHDTAVKSWARLTGYVMPRSGRVTNEVRDAYRVAHGLPVPSQSAADISKPKSGPTERPDGIDITDVRAWAVRNGIPVGTRGRIKPEVLAAYQEAHGG